MTSCEWCPQGEHGGTASVIWLCSLECCRDWIMDHIAEPSAGRVLRLVRPAPKARRCGECGVAMEHDVPLCDRCARRALEGTPPRDPAPS
jgi:hypothetical protein